MAGTAHETARPMRRDAARNQELVLAAAREVLAECGPEASMETIAARAGVGVGTVYRRFPSKDALISELVSFILDELIQSARAAVARADGSGLEAFLRVIGQSLADHRRYADRLMNAARSEYSDTLRALIADLHQQAREHATIDPAITLPDVMTTLWALRGVVETTGEIAPHAWERHLDIHLAGLRLPPGAGIAPSMTAEQLQQLR